VKGPPFVGLLVLEIFHQLIEAQKGAVPPAGIRIRQVDAYLVDDLGPPAREVVLDHVVDAGAELGPDEVRGVDDGVDDAVPDERPVLLVYGEGQLLAALDLAVLPALRDQVLQVDGPSLTHRHVAVAHHHHGEQRGREPDDLVDLLQLGLRLLPLVRVDGGPQQLGQFANLHRGGYSVTLILFHNCVGGESRIIRPSIAPHGYI
jgi:hypothetical protein